MVRKTRLIPFAALVLLVQAAAVYRFSYGILRVDLLYLLAAYLSLEASPAGALWCALAIGVLRDLGSSGGIGESAVVMVAGAAGLLTLRDRVYRENVPTNVVLVFAFVLFCGFAQATGVCLAVQSAHWGTLLTQAFGQAATTAALVPPAFALFDRLGLVDKEKSALA